MEKTPFGKKIAPKNGWFPGFGSRNGYVCFTTRTVSVRTHPLKA